MSTTGGTTATALAAADECMTVTSGYVQTDEFAGYAYTFAAPSTAQGANPVTISPSCDTTGCSPNFSSNEICASGTVGQASDNGSSAGVTFNVNQSNTSDPYNSPFTTSLGSYGLRVDYSNTAGSPLRVQLIDSAWKTYCYVLPPASGTSYITWGRFNTTCGDDSGTGFSADVPIVGIQLMVPGSSTRDTPFNFCLSCVRTFSALQ